MLKFLYDTGARASEMCKLRVMDYNYKNKKGTFK